jgi:hypothetical protein
VEKGFEFHVEHGARLRGIAGRPPARLGNRNAAPPRRPTLRIRKLERSSDSWTGGRMRLLIRDGRL